MDLFLIRIQLKKFEFVLNLANEHKHTNKHMRHSTKHMFIVSLSLSFSLSLSLDYFFSIAKINQKEGKLNLFILRLLDYSNLYNVY